MAIALFWLFNCILDATERNLAGWQKLFSCVFRLGPNRVSVWWWHQSSQLFLQMKSIFPVNEIYFPSKRNPFSQLAKFIFPVKEICFSSKRNRLSLQTNKERKWRVAKSIPYYNICARGSLSALPGRVLCSFFRSSLLHCSFLLSWGRAAGCCGAEARVPGRSEQAAALRQA